MSPEFPGPVPEIPVKEIEAAAAYYQGTLGFTLDWGGDELGLAGISRGNCRIFLGSSPATQAYAARAIAPAAPVVTIAASEPISFESRSPMAC